MTEKYAWQDEEELVDPEDSVFRLSASSVKTHHMCPYQFYLSKIERRPGTKSGKGYAELGSAVHESIETVLGEDRWREPPRPQNQLRQEVISEFRKRNPNVEDDLWDRGMNCLETFAKYMSQLRDDLSVANLEEEFNFSLGRSDVQAKFKGYIDLTTEDEVIDWKTGSVRETGETIQGAVYMRGFQELYGRRPEKVTFVYLKEGKERSLEPDDENWNEMIRHAKRCVEDIRRDSFEAKPEGGKCYFCDVEGFCDASPVGAGGVDYYNYRDRRLEF